MIVRQSATRDLVIENKVRSGESTGVLLYAVDILPGWLEPCVLQIRCVPEWTVFDGTAGYHGVAEPIGQTMDFCHCEMKREIREIDLRRENLVVTSLEVCQDT